MPKKGPISDDLGLRSPVIQKKKMKVLLIPPS